MASYCGSVNRRILARLLVLLLWAGVVHVVTTPSGTRWPATLPLKVEVTFGATTVDVFPDVRKQEIRITCGAQPEGSVQPGSVAFELDNLDGYYTPDYPMSKYYPYVQLGAPVKVWVYWSGAWRLRFTGRVSEWKPFWPNGDLSTPKQKGDARVTVVAAGLLRQLGQGKAPLRSALYRSIAGVAPGDYLPHEYWPGEDGSDATQIASAISGHPAVVPAGPVTYQQDGPAGAASALQTDTGFSAAFPVQSYADTGRWAITWIMKINSRPAANTTTLLTAHTNGGPLPTWRFIIDTTFPDTVFRWIGYDAADVAQFEVFWFPTFGSDAIYGQWFMYTFGAYNNSGTTLKSSFAWDNGRDIRNSSISGANFTGQIGTLNDFKFTVDSVLGNVGIQLAHFGVFVDPGFAPFDPGAALANGKALHGWEGEQAHERIDRLCREFGIPLTTIGTQSALMGPQQIDTLYNVLNACAQVDMGILYEQRDGNGLVYRCLSNLYNQTPALTLDAKQNHLANPFRPALDDFGVRNDVTVQRRGGSEYRSVVETGPKSIQDPPNGAGTYDEKLILDLYTDSQTVFNATWRTWLGTWPGMRYSRISPDINAVADVATTWLGVDIGDLEQAINLPPQHPISTVEAIVRGYTETLTPTSWTVVTNAASAGPYQVGKAGDGSNASAWLQTGPGTALSARLAPGATTLTVTPDGPLFDTAANLTLNPLSLVLGGEVVAVQSISGAGPTQTIVVQRTLPKDHPIGTIVQVHRPLIACL